jgi:hypothetical protein
MLEVGQWYNPGTVWSNVQDLISYKLLSRTPFSVEECNVGSGAACGAVFLQKRFDQLLRETLGSRADSILTKDRLDQAMDWFERFIKCAYNPYDPSFDASRLYRVPMHNVPAEHQATLGLQGGYLKLTSCYTVCKNILTFQRQDQKHFRTDLQPNP